MIKEDQILLNHIEDKVQQCDQNYMITATGFLDMRQQSIVRRWCIANHVHRFASTVDTMMRNGKSVCSFRIM